jgi:hypothetical protein
MGNEKDPKIVSRREILKLAGTAAAFCASFGFLHGNQTGKETVQAKHLQMKWRQAELKWYKGDELLHSTEFPARVLKHLQSDEMSVIEIKWFRNGKLEQSLARLAANR